MKKLGLLTLIVISSVFLMSHNASAVTTVYDLSGYEPVVNQVYSTVDCNISGTNKSNVTWCYLDDSSGYKQLNKLITHNSFTLKKDDIIEFDVINVSRNLSSITNFNYVAMKPNDVTNLRMITTNQVSNVSGQDSYSINGTAYHWGSINSVMRMTYKVINDSYIPIGVLATDTTNNPSATWYQSGPVGLMWNIVDLTIYRKTGNSAINQEQEEATQDASDDSQTSGDNSQNSAENATQSLLTTINNGIGVITSARATNCQINGNMGNLDLGNLDLCANPVPTFVQIILSLVAVVTVIPLAIVLFNRFIGIFRSFQG